MCGQPGPQAASAYPRCGLLPSDTANPGSGCGALWSQPLHQSPTHHPAQPLQSPGHPPTGKGSLRNAAQGMGQPDKAGPQEGSARPPDSRCPETGGGHTVRGQHGRQAPATSQTLAGRCQPGGSHPEATPAVQPWKGHFPLGAVRGQQSPKVPKSAVGGTWSSAASLRARGGQSQPLQPADKSLHGPPTAREPPRPPRASERRPQQPPGAGKRPFWEGLHQEPHVSSGVLPGPRAAGKCVPIL